MAGKIIADIIEAPYNKVTLNVGNTTVATFNASGILSNTGNIMIGVGGTVSNTAITGTITQSQIGTNVVGTGPVFRAILSTNQTIATNVATKVAFSNETYDTNNNGSSGTFTPTVAGYYMVGTTIAWSGDITATFAISLLKNGSVFSYLNSWSTATQVHALSGSDIVYCNGTTDYIEIYISHSYPGNKYLTSATETFMFATLVRAA